MTESWGIKVSREGFSVGTLSGNDLGLILNTNTNSLKVHTVGTGAATINHNLGYVPPFLSYLDDALGEEIRLNTVTANSGTATFSNPSPAGGNSMYYFLFYNG